MALAAVYGDNSTLFNEREISAQGYLQTDKNQRSAYYVAKTTAVVKFSEITATITASEIDRSAKQESNSFEIEGTHGKIIFRTNPFSPQKGENRFDFIDNAGNINELKVNALYNAYTDQIIMAERDVEEKRIEAVRPTSRMIDSINIMNFLCEWEVVTASNAQSKAETLENLKAHLSKL